MTKDLTVGPPTRMILWFTLPLLVGNLFQQLYAVVDAIVVGRMLGVEALASVGASGSLHFLLFGFAIGTSSGLAIPVARAFGAGDLVGMRRAVTTGVVISGLVTVVISLLGVVASRSLLTLMGTPPELLDDAVSFLTVFFCGTAATVAFNYLAAVIRALGDSRTPLYFLILACLLNVGLVVLFIGGLHLGVGGAAAATVLAQLVSVVLCLVLIVRRMPVLRLHADDWRLSRSQLAESSRLGLTMGFQMSVIAVGAVILQYGINGLGATAVAAFTAALRVDQVAVAPLASFGVAIATYVAQNRGGREWRRIRVGVFRTGLVAVGVSFLLGVVIISFGTRIVRLFVGDNAPDVVEMAHYYLVISAGLYAILALLFVLRNALQGMGSATVPTIAGFMELLVRALAGLVLVAEFGFLGACLAAPLAWIGALVPLAVAWLLERRRLIAREASIVPKRESMPDWSVRDDLLTPAGALAAD
jgi:putative MATE family efflux protein